MLGVPGLMAGLHAPATSRCANAVGTGIADDKAIYSYMPEIVKFYLGEEPILKNVPTWRCREPSDSLNTCSIICPSWWSRKSTAPAATAC